MRRHTAHLCAMALVVTFAVACSTPGPGPRIPRAHLSPYSAPPVVPSAAPSTTSLGPAPENLHDVDWGHIALPGDFCGIPRLIRFTGDEATAQSHIWDTVHVGISSHAVVYGDVIGDSHAEAALPVECDNGGGTAAGQLIFGYLVFTSQADRLELLGTITPQQNPASAHTTLLGGIEMTPGHVKVQEQWYRQSDPDCCPSGKAITTWTVNGNSALAPGPPDITS